MQFAKDSFYAALRQRLAEVNPQRTVVVDGVVRPALVVQENESNGISAMDGAFRLTWGECTVVGGGNSLMKMTCTIEYATRGIEGPTLDRGRTLGALDGELFSISRPQRTTKNDFTKVPAASLGTVIFWTDLEFGAVKDEAGRISRSATTSVYFVPEVKQ